MTFDHCSKAAPECENLRSMIQINLNHGEVISGAESKCLVICPLNISIKIVKIFFERVCKSSALADWKEEKIFFDRVCKSSALAGCKGGIK